MGRRGRPRRPYRVGDEAEEDDAPAYVTARSKAIDATIKHLEGDGRVRAAALVGDTFKLDPVALLEEPSTLRRLIRLAAHNIVQSETERAHKRASKGK